jgi:HlyD family secretion protein
MPFQRDAYQRGVAAARAQLDLLRHGTRPEELRRLRAQEREARAALALAEKRLSDMQILSPITGIVTERRAEPGEVVLPGEPLLEVADRRRLWVRVYLREKEYGQVKVGDRVEIRCDSFPDRLFPGRVRSIAQEAEYTPRSVQTREERVDLMFAVTVDVDNPTGTLLIGMPIDARFPSRSD